MKFAQEEIKKNMLKRPTSSSVHKRLADIVMCFKWKMPDSEEMYYKRGMVLGDNTQAKIFRIHSIWGVLFVLWQ